MEVNNLISCIPYVSSSATMLKFWDYDNVCGGARWSSGDWCCHWRTRPRFAPVHYLTVAATLDKSL